MDDLLIWFGLLFLAWVAEGIVSARRKKRRQSQGGQARQRPARPASPPSRSPRPHREPGRAGGPAPQRAETPRRARGPEPLVLTPTDLIVVREPPPEEASPPEGLWAEGQARAPTVRPPTTLEQEAQIASLETLEPAGGASHVAFHEKYIDQPPPPAAVRRRLRLGRGDARRGIVLAEILGPPKGAR